MDCDSVMNFEILLTRDLPVVGAEGRTRDEDVTVASGNHRVVVFAHQADDFSRGVSHPVEERRLVLQQSDRDASDASSLFHDLTGEGETVVPSLHGKSLSLLQM